MGEFTEMFYGSNTGLGQIGAAYEPVQQKSLYDLGDFAQDTTAGYGTHRAMQENNYRFN